MEPDILDALRDLRKQATEERSHFYVRKCVDNSITEIERLRAALERLDVMISKWAKDQGFPRENSACWLLVHAALNPNS